MRPPYNGQKKDPRHKAGGGGREKGSLRHSDLSAWLFLVNQCIESADPAIQPVFLSLGGEPIMFGKGGSRLDRVVLQRLSFL